MSYGHCLTAWGREGFGRTSSKQGNKRCFLIRSAPVARKKELDAAAYANTRGLSERLGGCLGGGVVYPSWYDEFDL